MLVLRKILGFYNHLFNENLDARTKDLFLMGSPWPVIVILSVYLWFVLGNGQRWMKERNAFDLRKLINAFNVFQMISNAYVFVMAVVYAPRLDNFHFFCIPEARYDFSPIGLMSVNISYFFYLLKVIDLLDTVFFVLRKRNRQVTFLHIYHHAGMVLIGYIYLKMFSGGGYAIVLGVCNSFVHVVMYGYYFMTSYKPELKYSLWWKKHITQLQLIQFVIYFVFCCTTLLSSGCENSKLFVWIGLVQAIVMISMFTDFYIKAYVKHDT